VCLGLACCRKYLRQCRRYRPCHSFTPRTTAGRHRPLLLRAEPRRSIYGSEERRGGKASFLGTRSAKRRKRRPRQGKASIIGSESFRSHMGSRLSRDAPSGSHSLVRKVNHLSKPENHGRATAAPHQTGGSGWRRLRNRHAPGVPPTKRRCRHEAPARINGTLSCSCPTSRSKNFVSRARTHSAGLGGSFRLASFFSFGERAAEVPQLLSRKLS